MAMLRSALRSTCKLQTNLLTFNRFAGIARAKSTLINESSKEKTKNDLKDILEEWQPIYKFRYIKGFASLNKLKIYQTVFTLFAVPVSFTVQLVDPFIVSH